MTSLSLCLSSCDCLISEESSLYAVLPDVCKDQLGCSCDPERQQELWNQPAWVQAQGEEAGLIVLCCSLEKRDYCFHAAVSSTDVHPLAALPQLYLWETSHLLLVPNLSLCLRHSSFLKNSVVENDLCF